MLAIIYMIIFANKSGSSSSVSHPFYVRPSNSLSVRPPKDFKGCIQKCIAAETWSDINLILSSLPIVFRQSL